MRACFQASFIFNVVGQEGGGTLAFQSMGTEAL